MKKFLALILALCMVFSFCAVSAFADTEEPQKIIISTITSQGAQEGWEAVAKAYHELHPNVNVVIDLKALDGYDQWLANVFANNDTTDVDIVSINYAGGSQEGKYINWADYAEMDSPYSDGIWKDQYQYEMQTILPGTGAQERVNLDTTQVMWFYNQDIFNEVGVEPPTTWDEMIDVCEKIQAAGYQPIAMPGDYASFYSGTMGWLSQVYSDQTTRTTIDIWRSQPGDYTYDPDLDDDWKLDLTDPWNDDTTKVTRNPVRFYKALADGVYTPDTVGMHTVWTNFAKVFPKYAGGDAMFGTNGDGAQTLFYQGKAAMFVNTGAFIVSFANNMKAVKNSEKIEITEGTAVDDVSIFNLGSFAMPSMEGEGIEAQARTIEVAQGFLGAVSKSQAHDDLVADFMMYYSSAEGMGIFLNAAIAAGFAPNGPSLVYGVEYPEEIANAFSNIKYIGNCQKRYGYSIARGLDNLPESYREFYNNAYEYLTGSISVDEYLVKQTNNFNTYLDDALAKAKISRADLENPDAEPAG